MVPLVLHPWSGTIDCPVGSSAAERIHTSVVLSHWTSGTLSLQSGQIVEWIPIIPSTMEYTWRCSIRPHQCQPSATTMMFGRMRSGVGCILSLVPRACWLFGFTSWTRNQVQEKEIHRQNLQYQTVPQGSFFPSHNLSSSALSCFLLPSPWKRGPELDRETGSRCV